VRDRAARIADEVLFPSAPMVDHSGQIPPGHLDLLAAEGFYGLGSGGETRSEVARVVEELATGCLTTAFVWLQHLGAVRAAAGTDHPGVREEWLDPLRRGQRRAGLAFGGLRPGPASLVAHPVPGGYRFDGTVPWVSGWRYVDCLLAAARTPDDTIVWALVDTGPTGGASPTIDVERVPLVSVDASARLPEALRDAIGGNWPAADLPITVTAAPFADPSGGRSVAVVTIASERTAQLESSAPLDVLVEAFDRDGRSVNYHHQSLDIGTALQASGSGRFEIYSRLPLDPGRYELRAGIRDGASDRVGTVHTHVDVPDFARAPLSISGVLVEAFPAALAAPPALLTDLAEIQPTTRRVFARSDTVAVAARIYQGGEPRAVSFVIRVTDASGKHVRDQSGTIGADDFTGKRERSFEVRQPLVVDDLSPGEYLLTLQATRADRTEQRLVRFTIR